MQKARSKYVFYLHVDRRNSDGFQQPYFVFLCILISPLYSWLSCALTSSNPSGFYSLHGVTVLWHGWLKKLGRFSKRWRKRYFVFLSTSNGMKELRHYDTLKDVNTLLMSTPQGVISLTDATGICCFTPVPTSSRKPTKFV